MRGALQFSFTQEEPVQYEQEVDEKDRYIIKEHKDIWVDPRNQEPLYIVCETVADIKNEALRLVVQIVEKEWNDSERYFINPRLYVKSPNSGNDDWESLYLSDIEQCTKEHLRQLTGKDFFTRGFDIPQS